MRVCVSDGECVYLIVGVCLRMCVCVCVLQLLSVSSADLIISQDTHRGDVCVCEFDRYAVSDYPSGISGSQA